ncbi:MAG: PAS domain-containing sensor histidine kinase [Thermodesulfobacteriota bacterium]
MGLVALAAFATELAIMVFLYTVFPSIPHWAEAGLDAALLVVLLSPALYTLVVRPMRLQIEERRDAEAVARASEQRYRRFLEEAADGIIHFDDRGRLRDVNGEACRMLGYGCEEMLGLGVEDLLVLEVPGVPSPLLAELQQGRIVVERREVRRKDGAWIVVEARLKRVGPGVYQVIFRDVTERDRLQQSILRSRDLYVQMFDAIPNPVWRADAAGSCDYFNRAWLGFTGRTMEEERGDGWTRGIHPEDLPRCLEIRHEAFAARLPFEHQFRLRHHSGEYRWVVDVGRPFEDLDGAFSGFVGACFDVTGQRGRGGTDRRSADRFRSLSAYLEKVREEERGRISREIHDDLGQSLTALRIELSLLAENPGAAERLGERVRPLRDLTDRTIRTVQRIAAELRPGILDDLGLAAAVEWQAGEFAKRTGIPCRCRVPEEEPAIAPHAGTAVFRIFQEALTNVARHAGARSVEVALGVEGELARLRVADDGAGITEEQVKSRTSMGLLGMRERAALLGGRVTVSAGAMGGTVVEARIPLRPQEERA